MPERPVTQLLEKVKSGDRDAADEIVRNFWESARHAAHRHLTAAVRRFQSASDIANAALRSALSELAKPNNTFPNRDAFERLVLKIVHRKRKSAARYALAEGRDVRRTMKGGDEFSRVADTSAENLVEAEHLGRRIIEILKREPDPLRRDIAIAGIHKGAQPTEIVRELAVFGGRAPALRTVQAIIQDAKRKLADALREEYGDLVPPGRSPKATSGGVKHVRKPAGKKAAKENYKQRPAQGRKKHKGE